jgi:hypothetical protein
MEQTAVCSHAAASIPRHVMLCHVPMASTGMHRWDKRRRDTGKVNVPVPTTERTERLIHTVYCGKPYMEYM